MGTEEDLERRFIDATYHDLGRLHSVTVARAAQIFDCDPSVIRRMLRCGDLRGHRLGKRGVRIFVDSIAEYQHHHGIEPTVGNLNRPNPRRLSAAHYEAMKKLKDLGVL